MEASYARRAVNHAAGMCYEIVARSMGIYERASALSIASK